MWERSCDSKHRPGSCTDLELSLSHNTNLRSRQDRGQVRADSRNLIGCRTSDITARGSEFHSRRRSQLLLPHRGEEWSEHRRTLSWRFSVAARMEVRAQRHYVVESPTCFLHHPSWVVPPIRFSFALVIFGPFSFLFLDSLSLCLWQVLVPRPRSSYSSKLAEPSSTVARRH